MCIRDRSYFPKLTGSQIRDILLKSVTSRKGVEVEKGIRVNDRDVYKRQLLQHPK